MDWVVDEFILRLEVAGGFDTVVGEARMHWSDTRCSDVMESQTHTIYNIIYSTQLPDNYLQWP